MAGRVTTPAGRQRRRPTKTGVILDEVMIVDTALHLIEEHGAAGLSARRLGRALGADHTVLYRYFRSMDDLVLAMTDELIARVTKDWSPTGDWKSDLYQWGLNAHAVYMKHPQAAVMSTARISARPAELVGMEKILSTLRNAGFSDRSAVMYYGLFITQMLSYAAWSGARKILPCQGKQGDIERWTGAHANASADQYPSISATAELLEQVGRSDPYPPALRILLANMQAVLEQNRDSPEVTLE